MNSRKKFERIFELLDSMIRTLSRSLVFRVKEKSNSSMSALQHYVLENISTLSILQLSTWAMSMRLQGPNLSRNSRAQSMQATFAIACRYIHVFYALLNGGRTTRIKQATIKTLDLILWQVEHCFWFCIGRRE
jgi:hypothetical protein